MARAANIDRSLIGRWLNEGTQPSIESIRAVSRAFHRDIREGLVATGLFTDKELYIDGPAEPDMRLVDDDRLLNEVRRRMGRGRAARDQQVDDGDVFEFGEETGVDTVETEEESPGEDPGRGSVAPESEPAPKSTRGRRKKSQAEQRI